jgi:tRNA threonylcarbamoyladenosine biosynthesis protein TsaE
MALLVCQLIDAQATENLGAELAAQLPVAGVVALDGPLGAGKTTLTRGFLRALGHRGRVRSPSYSVLESYDLGGRRVLHLDLYRVTDPSELDFLGLREQLDARTLVLVEWPQRAATALPPTLLDIQLDYEGIGRVARLWTPSTDPEGVLHRLRSSIGNEQCQLTDGLLDKNACQ